MSRLQYKNLKIQPYLLSAKINLRRKGILFKLRTRMVSTPENFGKRVPCKICRLENESICHILTQCPAYQSTRDKILQEFEEICSVIQSNFNFENIKTDPETLTQFLLDPTSFNLKTRVHINDPVVPDLFKLSRDYCYAIHSEKNRKLEELHNI